MLKVDVLNMKGKKVEDLELNENVFGVEVNEVAVHTALVNFQANQRQGTQSTKTRSEVSGGGRKPWKQKGTGRARQGSIRAPQWIKGGIALGPKPRSYSYSIPKKVKQLAFRSVLTSKVQDGKLVLDEKNLNVQASARNIEGVKTTLVNTMNIFDLLKYDSLVLTKDAVKKLEEVYA